MSDHNWVHLTIDQSKALWPVKEVSFRRLSRINHDCMEEDIISDSTLSVDTAADTEALANQYHNTLSQILDKHAPLITRTFKVRPNVPWYSHEITRAKRERRRRERRWRRTRLASDFSLFEEQ